MRHLEAIQVRNALLAESYFGRTTPLERLRKRLEKCSLLKNIEKTLIYQMVLATPAEARETLADRDVFFLRSLLSSSNETSVPPLMSDRAQRVGDAEFALMRWTDDGNPLTD